MQIPAPKLAHARFISKLLRCNYRPYGSAAVPFDLAVIRLLVSTGARAVPILGSDTAGVGESVSVFGYGRDETSQTILGRMQAGEYDKLLKAGRMLITAISPDRRNLFASYDSTGQSACAGDSGVRNCYTRGPERYCGGCELWLYR